MQRVGEVEADIAVKTTVRGMPVRVVPRDLVGLQVREIFWDGFVELLGKFGEVRVGFIVGRGLRGDRRIKRILHETVVAHDGEDVGLSRGTKVRGEIEAEGGEAGFAHAEKLAIDVNFGDLARRLEFDKNFFTGASGGQRECFPVPGASAPLDLFAAMARGRPIIEGVRIVIGVRR